MINKNVQAAVFSAALLFCLTSYASPPLALGLGLALALTVGHPWGAHSSQVVKYLHQVAVGGL